jgi:hypothetical protein
MIALWRTGTGPRRNTTIGMVCTWIGGGAEHCSSAIARAVASSRPKPSKDCNEALSVGASAGRCAIRRGRRLRLERDTRAIWVSRKTKERARDRLTGIPTRGSLEPNGLTHVIWNIYVLVSRCGRCCRGNRCSWRAVIIADFNGNVLETRCDADLPARAGPPRRPLSRHRPTPDRR